jgi:hypothetical protein
VTSIVPLDGDFSVFNVSDATGASYTARKIVLGTGLRDLIPPTPGMREAFGKGIFWCPWCDGYGKFLPKVVHARLRNQANLLQSTVTSPSALLLMSQMYLVLSWRFTP